MGLKDWKNGGNEWDRSQRMQLKAWICILGIVLLLILLIIRAVMAFLGLDWTKPEPVIRSLTNVWIMEVGEGSLQIYEDGAVHIYEAAEGFAADQSMREQVADVVLTDEKVSQITCKRNKINGKVLSVDDSGVELEGYGRLPLSESVKGYRLYQTLSMCSVQDIMIGYDFTDFVIEEGKICGILMVKEEAMEYIRVLLKTGNYQSLLHEQIVLTCDTDYTLQYGSYDQLAEEWHSAGEVCTIDAQSGLFQEDRIRVIPSALTGKVILQNVSRSQGTPGYRGTIELLRTQDGIAVINEVLLEEYLYSVVPSEMPASYPVEALKAQAVCARTYAYRYLLQAGYPQFGAHVDDSTGFQVYNNILEQEAATTAVKETYGQVLLVPESGALAETYYYSTSCGIGSDADVWSVEGGESPDYLSPMPINRQTVREASENWDSMLKADALTEEAAFEEFIRSKDAQDYEVTEGWYRWSYSVTELDIEVLRERMCSRYRANPAHILTLREDGTYESREIGKWKQVLEISVCKRGTGGVAQELLIVTDEDTYKVITEYSIRSLLCDGQTRVLKQDGSEASAPNLLPSGFFVMDVVCEKEEVVGYRLTGGGYGHGVGMSQNGARHMAEEGMSGLEILTFFYKGCVVENKYT